MIRLAVLLLASSLTACSPRATSQPARTVSAPCQDGDGYRDGERVCEARTVRLDRRDLKVDASVNGSIHVEAWDGSGIELVSIVQAGAPRAAEARRLVDATRVETRGTVRAVAPDTDGRPNTYVSTSYRVRVPRDTDLDLTALNGSIAIAGVDGRVRLKTVNGSLRLSGLAGDVVGRTSNGSVAVELEGRAWEGTGLDLQTENGSVTITLPDAYSADLDASTKMGRISADGRVTSGATVTEGRWYGGSIEGTIGRGGAPIRAVTTNGSVRLRSAR